MQWYKKSQLSKIARRGLDLIIDFDQTICEKATYPKMGKPIDGVQDSLQELIDEGYRVRIYTCRLNGKKMKEVGKQGYDKLERKIREYLEEHEIPYTDIVRWFEGKPFGEHYVDDRNIPFDGDWKKVVRKILKGASGFNVRTHFASECSSGLCSL